MPQRVSEAYVDLYHYTTAIGLEGILKTQTIRATHYEYVNDSGEFKSYFTNRLPNVLKSCVGIAVKQAYDTNPVAKRNLDNAGGPEESTRRIEDELADAMTTAAQTSFEPYIASFCGVKAGENLNDGLLSQWRGYGVDGGYAIVLDAEAIENLLLQELNERYYSYVLIGDVDYHDHRTDEKSKLEEMELYEDQFKAAITKYILSGEEDDLAETFLPLISMSSKHKHIGFSEEAEVRVVAAPMSEDNIEEYNKSGAPPKNPVEIDFNIKNGLLVPYVTLFKNMKLPIKKIIVGPHTDRLKRKKSVIKLLAKYGVEAEVIVSEIPYVGN